MVSGVSMITAASGAPTISGSASSKFAIPARAAEEPASVFQNSALGHRQTVIGICDFL